jgi:hypothetical protein
MAFGNWVNSKTPPNDPNAGPPVGNEGGLTVKTPDGEQNHGIQSAHLVQTDEGALMRIRGEATSGSPRLVLFARLGENKPLDKPATGQKFNVLPGLPEDKRPSMIWLESQGDFVQIKGGTITVVNATGSNPWEIDAEVQLDTQAGKMSGKLEVRLRSASE